MGDMADINHAINNVATVASGAIQGAASKKLAEYQNKVNQEAATTSYNRQIELWNMQNNYSEAQQEKINKYNSPTEQRKRFESAGLNPAVMMSDGGTSYSFQNHPSSAPQQAPAAGYQLPIMETVSQAINLQAMQANIRKTDAETQTISNENSIFQLKTQQQQNIVAIQSLGVEGQKISNSLNALNLNLNNSLFDTNVSLTKQSYNSMLQQYEIETQKLLSAKFQNSLNPLTSQSIRNTLLTQGVQLGILAAEQELAKFKVSMLPNEKAMLVSMLNLKYQELNSAKRSNYIGNLYDEKDRSLKYSTNEQAKQISRQGRIGRELGTLGQESIKRLDDMFYDFKYKTSGFVNDVKTSVLNFFQDELPKDSHGNYIFNPR